MKRYKNLIIILCITIPLFIISGVMSYGDNLTYTIVQMQALLDAVNARVSTTAGVADAGKMVVLDGTGQFDSSLVSGGVGDVTVSGTPVANDFARFTDVDTIEGRSYAEAQADLSLEIGTDVQAWNETLDNLATISFGTNMLEFLAAANYADMRTLIGLVIGTDVLAEQTIGIADNNLVEVDGTPVNGEVAIWTAAGLDSNDEAEFKTAFNLEAGTDFYALAAAQSILTDSAGLFPSVGMQPWSHTVHTITRADILSSPLRDLKKILNYILF